MNSNTDNKISFNKYFSIFCFVVSAMVVGAFAYPYLADSYSTQNNRASVGESFTISINSEKNDAESFYKDINVDSRSVIIFDMDSSTDLYTKNSNEALPLASLVKIMTSYIALKVNDVYSGDVGKEKVLVKIDEESLLTGGDSGLVLNEVWKLEDLISFTMLVSSNDGASALARHFGKIILKNRQDIGPNDFVEEFVSEMNESARLLGLNLKFQNPSGLDEMSGIAGGLGSARDVSRLIAHVIGEYPSVFNHTSKPEMEFVSLSGVKHKAINTNTSIAGVSNVMGSKTGFTDMAGGNLAVSLIEPNGHKIILVVLNSTAEGRFTDMQKLINATNKYFGEI